MVRKIEFVTPAIGARKSGRLPFTMTREAIS
jgi:hypothetical protein